MAKEGRDDKGRFVKGNTHGITTEVARERQLKAAQARKDNRIVADALRRALMGKDPQSGDTMIVAIAKKTVEKMSGNGFVGDLRVAADILGELEQKVSVDGEMNFTFKFGDE